MSPLLCSGIFERPYVPFSAGLADAFSIGAIPMTGNKDQAMIFSNECESIAIGNFYNEFWYFADRG